MNLTVENLTESGNTSLNFESQHEFSDVLAQILSDIVRLTLVDSVYSYADITGNGKDINSESGRYAISVKEFKRTGHI